MYLGTATGRLWLHPLSPPLPGRQLISAMTYARPGRRGRPRQEHEFTTASAPPPPVDITSACQLSTCPALSRSVNLLSSVTLFQLYRPVQLCQPVKAVNFPISINLASSVNLSSSASLSSSIHTLYFLAKAHHSSPARSTYHPSPALKRSDVTPCDCHLPLLAIINL